MKFDLGHVDVRKRNRLPHWEAEHATYFVTFNLFDAIPRGVAERIERERDARVAVLAKDGRVPILAELYAVERWRRREIEKTLDRSSGACFMNDARIADVVAGALTYFDRDRYDLLAWSVMPNHVHVVFRNCTMRLDRVLHSWKSFSAKEANRLLRRAGIFWQEEYFDRVMRNARHLLATMRYVQNNPAKANLRDWMFAKSYPERLSL